MGDIVTAASLGSRLRALRHERGRRVVVGIVGPPGAGKSTLAERLASDRQEVALLPMDGYHLSQHQLVALGRADRKGAPDTFDVGGFIATLSRVREEAGDVFVPFFDRAIEEPIAAGLRVPADARIVIVEGNYLLHDADGWGPVAAMLDEAWYLNPPQELRRERLTRRHEQFGRSRTDAQQWVADVDERNAELIAQSIARADLILTGWER